MIHTINCYGLCQPANCDYKMNDIQCRDPVAIRYVYLLNQKNMTFAEIKKSPKNMVPSKDRHKIERTQKEKFTCKGETDRESP